jgi:hypothetical protein
MKCEERREVRDRGGEYQEERLGGGWIDGDRR